MSKLKYYIRILQLEGYDAVRFLRWVVRHQKSNAKHKEPTWTAKAKQIYWLSILLLVASVFAVLILTKNMFLVAVFFVLSFFLLPTYPVLAVFLLKPYEIANRLRVKEVMRNKIRNVRADGKLIVIGITGSYGKTSTKLVLHKLLPQSLITPKSYNTLFGIFKVVDFELSKRYSQFIVEMGAYRRGDVKEFCELTEPDIGILTGINEQHLERFGTINNTIMAKLEVLTGIKNNGTGVVNLDNELIRDNLKRISDFVKSKNVFLIGYTTEGYSDKICDEIISITHWQIKEQQCSFTVKWKNDTHSFTTSLLGKSHLSNILASLTVALVLKENIASLIERVAALNQLDHRLQLRHMGNLKIIDDTYSSNPTGFKEALELLNKMQGKKVLVTPGIVELGARSEEIHRALGSDAARICDELVLVGRSRSLEAFAEGAKSNGFIDKNMLHLSNSGELADFLTSRSQLEQTILLENDLPDQYI